MIAAQNSISSATVKYPHRVSTQVRDDLIDIDMALHRGETKYLIAKKKVPRRKNTSAENKSV